MTGRPDADAIVSYADLPALFRVHRNTIAEWVKADSIRTFPHPLEPPPALAVYWGDLPIGKHPKRWRRRRNRAKP